MPYLELSPTEALERYRSGQAIIVDVRTLPEWHGGHIPGAMHIPLDEMTGRYQELDPEAEILIICAHGVRSAAAGQWLAQVGFENVANVRRGMSAWPGPVEFPDGSVIHNT